MTDRPIPPGRIANSRRELAAWFGVSVVSIDNWLGAGCPALPSTGRSRRFDLLEVCRWKYGSASSSAPGDLDARAEAAALHKARRQEIELRIAERCRELIPAETFRSELGSALKQVATILEDLPDRLERKAGLPAQYVGEVFKVCDELREDIYRRLIA